MHDRNSPNGLSLRRGLSLLLMVAGFLTLTLLLGLFGCKNREKAQIELGPKQPDVSVMVVEPQEVPVTFESIAQVESSRQVNIQARVSGFLDKRVYTEGTIVKEGDTLFLMDQKPFKAQLDQATAALARQQAALDVATQDLNRVKPLAAANALSKKDLDDAEGRYQSSAAAVEQAKAEVDLAQLNLSYTVITSPVTGISGSADQADGTYLSPTNNKLTTVAVISPVYVNFSMSENDWLQYRNQIAKKLLIPPKDRDYVAEVVLPDGSIYPHTGKVTFAEPYFDPQTGTFLIRATFENPDNLLRPNQYVHIRLKGAVRPNAILVPQRAVHQSSKGHYVWLVDQEDKAALRPVIVGDWHGEEWFIDEGLRAGDRVAVDGVFDVRPGVLVKVHPLTEKAEAPVVSNDGSTSAGTGR